MEKTSYHHHYQKTHSHHPFFIPLLLAGEMRILAAIPSAANLFPSPPPNPRINEPLPSPPPPPLPLPPKKPPKPAAFRSTHNTTKYHKPVAPGTLTPSSSDDSTRSILIGDSGISYLLPGSPFEFQFSYSETPKARPLAVREPLFLPFAPPEMPRPWTGKSPLLSKKEKERRKGIRLVRPIGGSERAGSGAAKALRIAGRAAEDLGRYGDGRSREEVLGEPLTGGEAAELVKPYLSCNRQVNLGELDLFVEIYVP